jgi:hypothetical protein
MGAGASYGQAVVPIQPTIVSHLEVGNVQTAVADLASEVRLAMANQEEQFTRKLDLALAEQNLALAEQNTRNGAELQAVKAQLQASEEMAARRQLDSDAKLDEERRQRKESQDEAGATMTAGFAQMNAGFAQMQAMMMARSLQDVTPSTLTTASMQPPPPSESLLPAGSCAFLPAAKAAQMPIEQAQPETLQTPTQSNAFAGSSEMHTTPVHGKTPKRKNDERSPPQLAEGIAAAGPPLNELTESGLVTLAVDDVAANSHPQSHPGSGQATAVAGHEGRTRSGRSLRSQANSPVPQGSNTLPAADAGNTGTPQDPQHE